MKVYKFGGTSVADGSRLAAAARLATPPPGEPRLVVVSAMARVTRELLRIGQLAVAAPASARELVEGLLERHREAIAEAGIPPAQRAWLEEALAYQGALLLGLVEQSRDPRGLTPAAGDRLLATGELLSSRILAAALRAQGQPVVWIDPRRLVATDDRFGAARPDREEIGRRVRNLALPALARGEVVVTGGYIGETPEGTTTTLGFEASDYTATLLGAALGAEGVVIWTDVDGVASADPRLVGAARRVAALSYDEAADLAYFGAGVLHPQTMAPVVPLGIPIQVRNSYRPEASGTVISGTPGRPGVRGVTARGPFPAAELARFLAGGCGALHFRACNGAPAELPGHPAAVRVPGLELPSADLEARLHAFAAPCPGGLAVVSLVGSELPAIPGLVERAVAALAGDHLLPVAQRACGTHLSVVLPEELRLQAVRQLHAALLEGGEGAP
jgi:bifunctional aspartokinase / homoserine dehydrogenase 1